MPTDPTTTALEMAREIQDRVLVAIDAGASLSEAVDGIIAAAILRAQAEALKGELNRVNSAMKSAWDWGGPLATNIGKLDKAAEELENDS